MPDIGKEYKDFFTKTYALYKWVASYLLLLEKLDENYVNVGAINELRDIVSHLYAFIDKEQSNPESIVANHIKAKDHLERAYFDLFSALCTVLTDKITIFELKYSSQVLSEEYPNYYTHIRPVIHNLFDEEGDIRLNRDLSHIPSMESNDEIIKELKGFHNSLIKTVPSFEAKKKLLKRKRFWRLFLTIGMPIIAVLIAYLLSNLNKK